MVLVVLVLSTLLVAYSNGANDNFKGVATLYGSNTTTFRTALWIGTLATLAGCIASVFLAEALVKAFSGKGLVPDALSASPDFLTAVAIGAASTVMLATVLGFPISTTHALTGALVGAGFMGAGSLLNLSLLGSAFFLPLLISPLVAMFLAVLLYKLARDMIRRLGVERQSCLCIGPGQFIPVSGLAFDAGSGQYSHLAGSPGVSVTAGTMSACVEKYDGNLLGMSAQSVADGVHYLSAVAVSFARGLNDTPKIVGLMLVVKALDIHVSMLAVAVAMAVGGLLNARKVAETMSKKISTMNDGQALAANIVTAILVISASRFGLPVSTTHVAVGSISGVGLVKGTADKSVIASILLSWVLTLPTAALIAGTTYWVLKAAG